MQEATALQSEFLFNDVNGQQGTYMTYDKYRKYYIYYFYEMLLCAYEDYHLLKTILLGNMYLELYMVMDAIAWLDCKKRKVTYNLELQARTLSSLERRMRHNTGVTDGILSRVRKDFL